MNNLETYMLRVLKLYQRMDAFGELFWRTDGDFAPITFFAIQNDIFAWATADLEEITPENIAELERAVAEIEAIDPDELHWAPQLFSARIRKMRPQGAAYPANPKLAKLFDVCGPERGLSFDNPHKPRVNPE